MKLQRSLMISALMFMQANWLSPICARCFKTTMSLIIFSLKKSILTTTYVIIYIYSESEIQETLSQAAEWLSQI